MPKLLLSALTLVFATGVGLATTASAAPQASTQQSFTCMHFQYPTVQLVWSHVCHF
jgi:hypothetical protein